jgi:hypothetical protein
MRLGIVSLGIEHLRTDEISQLPTVPDFASVFRQECEIHWLVTSVGDMSGRRDGLTTYDSTATLEHPIFHPSTFMGVVSLLVAGFAQLSPKDFLPDKYVGVRIAGGIIPSRLLLLPAVTVTGLYMAAGVQIYEGRKVRGHLCSMLISFACATVAFWGVRLSIVNWAIFGMYFGYGALYDGRRLALYSDGAPFYRSGDMRRILDESSADKVRRRQDHDNAISLRKRQHEGALAAAAAASAMNASEVTPL